LGERETGGSNAAPIFRDFMAAALEDKPGLAFRIPPGLRLVRVDAKTGQLARPGDRNVIWEAFKPGTENAPGALIGGGESADEGDALTVAAPSSPGASPPAVPATGTGGLY
jgi:penicillin-binding protein 1A